MIRFFTIRNCELSKAAVFFFSFVRVKIDWDRRDRKPFLTRFSLLPVRPLHPTSRLFLPTQPTISIISLVYIKIAILVFNIVAAFQRFFSPPNLPRECHSAAFSWFYFLRNLCRSGDSLNKFKALFKLEESVKYVNVILVLAYETVCLLFDQPLILPQGSSSGLEYYYFNCRLSARKRHNTGVKTD